MAVVLVLAFGVDRADRGPAGPALLLRTARISPFTVTCNAAHDRPDGPIVSALHCAEGAAYVAVGGTSVCTDEGWTIRPITAIHPGRSDLAVIEWDGGDADEVDAADVVDHRTVETDRDDGASGPVRVSGFARRDGAGAMSCDLVELELHPVPVERCVEITDRHDAADIECLTGAPVCPGWSGAGVFDGGGLRAVVVAGNACGDPGGLVIARQVDLDRRDAATVRSDRAPVDAGPFDQSDRSEE